MIYVLLAIIGALVVALFWFIGKSRAGVSSITSDAMKQLEAGILKKADYEKLQIVKATAKDIERTKTQTDEELEDELNK